MVFSFSFTIHGYNRTILIEKEDKQTFDKERGSEHGRKKSK
jgi:hypothetical protein